MTPVRHHGHVRRLAAGAMITALAALGAPKDDLAPLARNLRESYCSRAPTADQVQAWLASLRPDGTWPDIDYENRDRSGWATARHVRRLAEMAAAYGASEHPLSGAPALRDAMLRALSHWLEKDYRNPNWWWNRIGVPMAMAPVLLVLQDDLPKSAFEQGVNGILARSGIGMTGQNKVWVAGITLVRGILLEDRDLVERARAAVVAEIRVTTAEGVQPDFSFHQHGAQQQFGNYGLAFIHDELKWARRFSGTEWALDEQQSKILRDYLLEGLAWVLWRGRLDISACGRQLAPHAQEGKGRSTLAALEALPSVVPTASEAVARAVARQAAGAENDLTGFRHFWRSDLTVYRQPTFYVSVKMSSARVIGTETCNSENLCGSHLGDGAVYVYLDGDEYRDLFPVWNWRRLPGTTLPQDDRSLVPNGRNRNRERFVGGLSNGTAGLSVLQYQRDGTRARKAWFLGGRKVVCLGTGISSDVEVPVVTTLNQCRHQGPITTCRHGQSTPWQGGTQQFDASDWIHHDRVAYVLLARTAVQLTAGTRRGSWRRIKSNLSADPVERDVAELVIDHGVKPQDASYAYLLLPDTTPKAVPDILADDPVKVLSNTPAVQAVQWPKAGRLQAAFLAPASLPGPGHVLIAAAQACLVMLEPNGDGSLTLSAADPSQTLNVAEFTLGGAYVAPNDEAREVKGGTSVRLPLPSGGRAGSPVSVALQPR